MYIKFLKFLQTLKTDENLFLIESIREGYMACFEYSNVYSDDSIVLLGEFPEFIQEMINYRLGEHTEREQFSVKYQIKEDLSGTIVDILLVISDGTDNITLAYNKKQEYKGKTIPITNMHIPEVKAFIKNIIEKTGVLV